MGARRWLYEAGEQAPSGRGLDPGGFGRHDAARLGHAEHLVDVGGPQRKGNVMRAAGPLEAREAADASHERHARIAARVVHAEDGLEDAVLEERGVQCGERASCRRGPKAHVKPRALGAWSLGSSRRQTRLRAPRASVRSSSGAFRAITRPTAEPTWALGRWASSTGPVCAPRASMCAARVCSTAVRVCSWRRMAPPRYSLTSQHPTTPVRAPPSAVSMR